MLPIVRQIVDSLRHDDPNPIHALDGWLLAAIQKVPPSTVQELGRRARMRVGPHTGDTELTSEQLQRWVRDALDRRVIAVGHGEPGTPPAWSLTALGATRLKSLGGMEAAIGGLIARIAGLPSVWEGAVQRLAQEEDVAEGEPPPRRPDLPEIKLSPADVAQISDEQARENLQRVEHIVVLMMENRSFDHMLGYLDTIDGQREVRGPSGAKPIVYDGTPHTPGYLRGTAFPKSMDPPHGKKQIAKQINGGAMDGFIESIARENDIDEPWRVMGYYTYRELPVYDYFAYNFLLCDSWHSSVPSATWPNRLYSLTGTCDPDREGLFDGRMPLYDAASFVRLLADEKSPDTWRWYSWDPATLRLVDDRYRLNVAEEFHHDHFRRVAQHSIEPSTAGDHDLSLGTGFLEDCANGDLPRVSWIDPNFIDLSILDANSNDDHPPSDVRSGQELMMLVFRALAESPCWKDTMLVVTYDEHGGFYDHVPPPAPPEDDPQFPTYGVRVPAFVVSPFVDPCTVTHRLFDHTSIIRTILERFGVEGAVAEMAKTAPRVAKAEHLGHLLTRDAAGAAPAYHAVSAMLDDWRHGRAERRSAASPEIAVRSAQEEPWKPAPVTGFPAEFLNGARLLREQGLPAGHP